MEAQQGEPETWKKAMSPQRLQLIQSGSMLRASWARFTLMVAGRSWGVRAPFAGATGGFVGAGTGPCAAPVVEASEGMGDLRAEPLSRHLEKAALGWRVWVGESGLERTASGRAGHQPSTGASSRRVLSPQGVQQHRRQPLAAAQGTLHPAEAHPGNVVAAEAHPAVATEKQILR